MVPSWVFGDFRGIAKHVMFIVFGGAVDGLDGNKACVQTQHQQEPHAIFS
jgi:hypothetical protein